MQVSKWGNSLAVRLPAAVVQQLKLKPGDDIEVRAAGTHEFIIERALTREEAVEGLRRLARPLPRGFKFDRREANARR